MAPELMYFDVRGQQFNSSKVADTASLFVILKQRNTQNRMHVSDRVVRKHLAYRRIR